MVRGEAGMGRLRGSCGEENCLPLIHKEVEEGGGERCEGEDSWFCRILYSREQTRIT